MQHLQPPFLKPINCLNNRQHKSQTTARNKKEKDKWTDDEVQALLSIYLTWKYNVILIHQGKSDTDVATTGHLTVVFLLMVQMQTERKKNKLPSGDFLSESLGLFDSKTFSKGPQVSDLFCLKSCNKAPTASDGLSLD